MDEVKIALDVIRRAVAEMDWDRQKSVDDLLAEARTTLAKWRLRKALADAFATGKPDGIFEDTHG